MKNLLEHEFVSHYQLKLKKSPDILYRETNSVLFELKDDDIIIYEQEGKGVAKYKNDRTLLVKVMNYECFIKTLPESFRKNREVCDLIVYTDSNEYFLLNELSDTMQKYINPYENTSGKQEGKRNKAIRQLKNSLKDLMEIENIENFIKHFSKKRCLFFNTQPYQPPEIKAVKAFNRINNIKLENGFRMENKEIEKHGFSFYEYSGNQIFNLI
ncbi:MAG: hypothetical protein A2Y41_00765 [Spirochaetes bacterium GWB1_36_13]|nr:MAG: hypothetical protein A2Y41_00765 [Spirochaetes bacterium GWB1_36_13]